MKKILFLSLCLAFNAANSQWVQTVGTGGDFTTLKQAFDTIRVKPFSDTLRLVLLDSIYNEPQLLLQPAGASGSTPAIIISPSGYPLSGHVLVNISHVDSIPDNGAAAGMLVQNAPSVAFYNVSFAIDTSHGFQNVVSLWGWGGQSSIVLDSADISGPTEYCGIDIEGDSVSLELTNSCIHDVGSGISLMEGYSLSVSHSTFSRCGSGIEANLFGGAVSIVNSKFNVKWEAIEGGFFSPALTIAQDSILGGWGINILDFEGWESGPSAALQASFASAPNGKQNGLAALKEASREKITALRAHDTTRMKQASEKWTSLIQNFHNLHVKMPFSSTPVLSISNNYILPDSNSIGVFVQYCSDASLQITNNTIITWGSGQWVAGIDIENMDDEDIGVGDLVVRSNSVQMDSGWTGILLDDIECQSMNISDNGVHCLRSRWSDGAGISANMPAATESIAIDSNYVEGFVNGLLCMGWANGCADVIGNNVRNVDWPMYAEFGASNLDVEKNRIVGLGTLICADEVDSTFRCRGNLIIPNDTLGWNQTGVESAAYFTSPGRSIARSESNRAGHSTLLSRFGSSASLYPMSPQRSLTKRRATENVQNTDRIKKRKEKLLSLMSKSGKAYAPSSAVAPIRANTIISASGFSGTNPYESRSRLLDMIRKGLTGGYDGIDLNVSGDGVSQVTVDSNTIHASTNNGITLQAWGIDTLRIASNIVDSCQSWGVQGSGDFEYLDISNNIIDHNGAGFHLDGYPDLPYPGVFEGNIIRDNHNNGSELFLYGCSAPLGIQYNTIVHNDSAGLFVSGDGAPPVVLNNNLCSNSGHALVNGYSTNVDARYNYWGASTTTEMDTKPYPSNISAILDHFDDTSKGFVNYAGWLHDSTGGPASINGMVYNDANGNGSKDSSETGIFSWPVFLDTNGNDSLDLDEPYATTDRNGYYHFFNLSPGTYRVREVHQPGWNQTSSNPADIILVSDSSVAGVDFGNAFTGGGYLSFYIGPNGGTWSNPINWTGGATPAQNSSVTIPYGITVRVDSLPTDSIHSLQVNAGALLSFLSTAGILKIAGEMRNDGTIQFPATSTPSGMICSSNFFNYNTILPGKSTVTLFGNNPKILTGGTFYNLEISGNNTSTAGNLEINNQLMLHRSLNVRSTDTISIQNPAVDAIEDTGRIATGTIRRSLMEGETRTYRFESPQSFVRFYGSGVYPSAISETVWPDSTISSSAWWVVEGGTIDTVHHTVRIDSVQRFSRWALGPPRPQTLQIGGTPLYYGVPAVKRLYDIEPQSGNGLLLAGLQLRYEAAEVETTESTLQLLRGPVILATATPRAGWNMVSLSVSPDNTRKTKIFPGAISDAFCYARGYVPSDTISCGAGYWLKFNRAEVDTIIGYERQFDSIQVVDRWNIIGSITKPVPVSSINSDPPGIVTSKFFTFNGAAYDIADSIKPGLAYWVKCLQSGKLILAASGIAAAKNRIRIGLTGELPPPPPDMEEHLAQVVPKEYRLGQNYPNPFNPTTAIQYELPVKSKVMLKVYDVLGQFVTTLVDEIEEPGYRTAQWNSSNVASGVYFYQLTATSIADITQGLRATKRMMLIR